MVANARQTEATRAYAKQRRAEMPPLVRLGSGGEYVRDWTPAKANPWKFSTIALSLLAIMLWVELAAAAIVYLAR